jgi:hypothetical protein
MKTRSLLLSIAVVMSAAVGAGTAPPLVAQSTAQKKAVAATPPALTAVQALPLTCAEAWIASQKNYAQLRSVVVTLAKVSLVNREMTFPNQRAAGLDAGKGIAADCKADPHALLFAVVDKHVRRLGVAAQR